MPGMPTARTTPCSKPNRSRRGYPFLASTSPKSTASRTTGAPDAYACAAGKALPFHRYHVTADGSWVKLYWAAYGDCQQCPLKPTCVPGAKRKQLTKTIYDAPYRRAWQRQQSRRGQRLRRVRQGTVEPVFGNLLHHYGLRRMNVRGQAGAHKTMLLTAVAFNLKKLLRYRPQQHLGLPAPQRAIKTRCWRLRSRYGGQTQATRRWPALESGHRLAVLQQPPPF